jgi:hypothetical protein
MSLSSENFISIQSSRKMQVDFAGHRKSEQFFEMGIAGPAA